MAIVEDDAHSESEDDTSVDPVLDEMPDSSDDSEEEEDDEAIDAALESKVAKLELQLKSDAFCYEAYVELVKAYWALSDLDRWRPAFDRFISHLALKPEEWLMRIRTEISMSHTAEQREVISNLFEKALLDGYSVEILNKWCSWALTADNAEGIRQQLRKIVEIAGADPLSGKVFWDALYEFEKGQLDSFRSEAEESDDYARQQSRVVRCLEEMVSRPLLRGADAWPLYEQAATAAVSHGAGYVAGTRKDHELATMFLERISPFEDRLLTAENETEEKLKIFDEYIEELEALCGREDMAKSRDFQDTLKAVLDRACSLEAAPVPWLQRWTEACARRGAGAHARALLAAARRRPRVHTFHCALMRQAEARDPGNITEVHQHFEAALLRGMESFKEGEKLWLGYIEYKRRHTDFERAEDVDRLRSTFRLAWDSLATCYGDEANDCEVPLYWARIEYQRMKAPKEGRQVFEEIFKYGSNSTMSKYWEALLRLEQARVPAVAPHKLRELFKRAARACADYPPAVCALYTHYEQDYGDLASAQDAAALVEKKIEEWRASYKKMKESMTGKKNNRTDYKKHKSDSRNKQDSKKPDKKSQAKSKVREKNESDGKRGNDASEGKRKRDSAMDVDETEKAGTSQGVKRSHDSHDKETNIKKPKMDSEDTSASREACTLFVSNLEFKVSEQNLRDKLSQYGEIESLRLRTGVKAFGGSICYCQYTTSAAVDRAVQHDRCLLDGRPMFLSRYSADKKRQFKYGTEPEKNKLFVKNLPFKMCTRDQLTELFQPHGKLAEVRPVMQKDGRPRGLAYIEFEDAASAAKAVEATNGLLLGERTIEVAISAPPPRSGPGSAGPPAVQAPTTMRRTKLTSFLPSVLNKPVASNATPSSDNKPKSNSDFRNLLLAKKQ